ncbi:hypothetical protein CC78DRAFT_544065 [Lojkania enalia]|uniref:Uncharacterized protein n=1 Tax=Lojkania enalia TaxID=147567 RepID=A0A9P4K9F8_9PLEO|nr:hypothetical protein CC78DRAFT_544065 [Didymosphaeria enalia]
MARSTATAAFRNPETSQAPPTTTPTPSSEKRNIMSLFGKSKGIDDCSNASAPVQTSEYVGKNQGDHAQGNNMPRKGPTRMLDQHANLNLSGRHQDDALAYGHPPPPAHTLKDTTKVIKNKVRKQWDPRGESKSDWGVSDADRYRDERDELLQLYKELQEENDKLKDELANAQHSIDRTKRSANQMQATMDNKELFLGVQAHDDDIRARFSSLLSSIKTWSSHFTAGNSHAFREDVLAEYQTVAPRISGLKDLENFVSNKRSKRYFTRGWAAYVMSKTLFRTLDEFGVNQGKDVWLNQTIADSLSRMENELWYTGKQLVYHSWYSPLIQADRKAIPYRAFNDWRAFTTELLSKALKNEAYKADEQMRKAVARAVGEVMEVVSLWSDTSDPKKLQTYEVELSKVFTGAVQLAQFLRRQRALWSIRFPLGYDAGPLVFNSTCMRDDRGNDEDMDPDILKQKYIEIVITPALYKRGTMNGEKFESEEAAVSAIVAIDTS